jgi:hypothetical protein
LIAIVIVCAVVCAVLTFIVFVLVRKLRNNKKRSTPVQMKEVETIEVKKDS